MNKTCGWQNKTPGPGSGAAFVAQENKAGLWFGCEGWGEGDGEENSGGKLINYCSSFLRRVLRILWGVFYRCWEFQGWILRILSPSGWAGPGAWPGNQSGNCPCPSQSAGPSEHGLNSRFIHPNELSQSLIKYSHNSWIIHITHELPMSLFNYPRHSLIIHITHYLLTSLIIYWRHSWVVHVTH